MIYLGRVLDCGKLQDPSILLWLCRVINEQTGEYGYEWSIESARDKKAWGEQGLHLEMRCDAEVRVEHELGRGALPSSVPSTERWPKAIVGC